MKYLVMLLLLLFANLADAKSTFDGAWAQRQEDLELLIITKPDGKVDAVLKTNSFCKPIFVKMSGYYTEQNLIAIYSGPIRLPNKCILEMHLSIGVAFSNSEMKVTEGGVVSTTYCSKNHNVETDTLKGRSFYRINSQNFFKPKKIMEI